VCAGVGGERGVGVTNLIGIGYLYMRKLARIIILFFSMLTASVSLGQTNGWEWGQTLWKENFGDLIRFTYTATDSKGNCYVAGMYTGYINLGGFSIASKGKPSDIFIAKCNSNGNVEWLKSIGSDNRDYLLGLTIDSKDNIYLGGSFSDTITIGDTVIPNINGPAAFLVKLSPNFDVDWVFTTSNDQSEGIIELRAQDSNIFVAGYFDDDSLKLGNNILHTSHIFVAKFSSSGTIHWATDLHKIGGGLGVSGIVSDENNGLLVSFILPEGGYLDKDTVIKEGDRFINYLIRLDSTGNVSWKKRIEGSDNNGIPSIVCHKDTIFVVGTFIDTLETTDTTIVRETDTYESSFFVLKLASNGTLLKSWTATGFGSSAGLSLCKDSLGNVYASGIYSGLFQMNEFIDTPIKYTGFICRLDEKLSKQSFIYTSKKEACWIFDISSNINNELYCYGRTEHTDSVTIGNSLISSMPYNYGYFIAKHSKLTLESKNSSEFHGYKSTIFPNPSTSECTVNFLLPSPSPVTITLHDILGREVLRREMGVQTEGQHEESVDVSGLPIGSYIVKISTNGEVFTSRISVVR
jgi:hypothetical protein